MRDAAARRDAASRRRERAEQRLFRGRGFLGLLGPGEADDPVGVEDEDGHRCHVILLPPGAIELGNALHLAIDVPSPCRGTTLHFVVRTKRPDARIRKDHEHGAEAAELGTQGAKVPACAIVAAPSRRERQDDGDLADLCERRDCALPPLRTMPRVGLRQRERRVGSLRAAHAEGAAACKERALRGAIEEPRFAVDHAAEARGGIPRRDELSLCIAPPYERRGLVPALQQFQRMKTTRPLLFVPSVLALHLLACGGESRPAISADNVPPGAPSAASTAAPTSSDVASIGPETATTSSSLPTPPPTSRPSPAPAEAQPPNAVSDVPAPLTDAEILQVDPHGQRGGDRSGPAPRSARARTRAFRGSRP